MLLDDAEEIRLRPTVARSRVALRVWLRRFLFFFSLCGAPPCALDRRGAEEEEEEEDMAKEQLPHAEGG